MIDVEVIQHLSEMLKPIDTSVDELGVDAISGVEPGGHFFGAEHTMERYESAFYTPFLSDWQNNENWQAAGAKDATSRIFYAAFAFTSAANVLIIFACTPLVAAIFSRVLFGERIAFITKMAILGSALGLGVVTSGSLESGQWVGDGLAFIDVIFLGLLFAIIRGRKQSNMVPATALGLLLAAGVSFFFADFPTMAVNQWIWLVLGGAILLPVAISLLTVGPRFLPAAEAAMLTLMESVLGPLWLRTFTQD